MAAKKKSVKKEASKRVASKRAESVKQPKSKGPLKVASKARVRKPMKGGSGYKVDMSGMEKVDELMRELGMKPKLKMPGASKKGKK